MNSRLLLRIYLQDHHAASAGGVAVARRALGPSHPLAKQIARDRDALERVMRQLDVTPSALKVGVVRVAELVGRLKLNGRIFERSPLSSVVELETLVVGVRGKEALWTALQRAGISLKDADLDALVESARAQGAELEALRLSAVAKAFARASGGISAGQAAAAWAKLEVADYSSENGEHRFRSVSSNSARSARATSRLCDLRL